MFSPDVIYFSKYFEFPAEGADPMDIEVVRHEIKKTFAPSSSTVLEHSHC